MEKCYDLALNLQHSVQIVVRKALKPTFCFEETRNIFQTLIFKTKIQRQYKKLDLPCRTADIFLVIDILEML